MNAIAVAFDSIPGGLWEFGIDICLKSTLLLILAFAIHWVLRRRQVLTCSVVWNACLLGLALLLVATLAVPKIPLRVMPSQQILNRHNAQESLSRAAASVDTMLTDQLSASLSEAEAKREIVERAESFDAAQPIPALAPTNAKLNIAALRVPVSGCLILIAGIGTILSITRLVHSMIAVHRLVRTAQPIEIGPWQWQLNYWTKRMGLTVPVEIRQEPRISVPMVVGSMRSMILIPSSMVREKREETMDVVLLHELAHVARGDYRWQLLFRCVQAMYWFHPLVWLVQRPLSVIRERACDEFCVHAIGCRQTYSDGLRGFPRAYDPRLVRRIGQRAWQLGRSQVSQSVTKFLRGQFPETSRMPTNILCGITYCNLTVGCAEWEEDHVDLVIARTKVTHDPRKLTMGLRCTSRWEK